MHLISLHFFCCMDALLVFFLFVLFTVVWKHTLHKKKRTLEETKAYIAALKVELLKYQANSTFVARALVQREIEKQREFVDNNRPTGIQQTIIDHLSSSVASTLFTLFIIYMWWDTPIFVFPIETVDTNEVVARSASLFVYSPLPPNSQFMTLSSIQKFFFGLLSSPQWPMGTVGIVSWSVICRSVISLFI
mmetsp:Transcript_17169/g.21875  ORF Transcript_17169/g.21875 Transcript_17169/m.21875 type:complete len:191 (-) Transcript_17169:1386-1958(-)